MSPRTAKRPAKAGALERRPVGKLSDEGRPLDDTRRDKRLRFQRELARDGHDPVRTDVARRLSERFLSLGLVAEVEAVILPRSLNLEGVTHGRDRTPVVGQYGRPSLTVALLGRRGRGTRTVAARLRRGCTRPKGRVRSQISTRYLSGRQVLNPP